MRGTLLLLACAAVVYPHHPAQALPPSTAKTMIRTARGALGVPYEFGGRLRESGEGIDCQGVLFIAAESVSECGWRSFDTRPTRSVKYRELGVPVHGMAPTRSEALDISRLEPGDILLLVGPGENPREPSIATLDEPVWVWHTGMYTGDGKWIVGDHIAGQVVETDLAQYLADNADAYTGVFVTRMKNGPKPRRCRDHAPMGPYRAAEDG